MKVEATPWRALIVAGFHLGVSPREFWRLSLKEWRALTTPAAAADALSRAAFNELAQLFPDSAYDAD
jgi:uncharacterized phage protein (TIGR02216 family)